MVMAKTVPSVGKRYVKIIEDITKNNNVKAIVLRVNSPGGSAMASENIWRALTIAKGQGLAHCDLYG